MATVGEIRYGSNIERFCGLPASSRQYIYAKCDSCGKERWVRLIKGTARNSWCKKCAKLSEGRKRTQWHKRQVQGYNLIRVYPEDFFYPMIDRAGYVLEHRLVMAKHLGRNLQRWEIVHHKNHTRDDNRIENLQLVSDDRHKQLTILENRIKILEARVTMLEAENVILKGGQNVAIFTK